MARSKPQNHVLMIATLGVYLGLILAGATPQVVAQAATIRAEVDRRAARAGSAEEFSKAYSTLLIDKARESQKDVGLPAEPGSVQRAATLYSRFVSEISRSLGPLSDGSARPTPKLWFQGSFDRPEISSMLKLEISLSEIERDSLTIAFTPADNAPADAYLTAAQRHILKNSTIQFTDTHLVIVTRLARAGLDALLADAK